MTDTVLTVVRLDDDGHLVGTGSTLETPVIPVAADADPEGVGFARPYATWVAAHANPFPTNGVPYRDFENEIIASASADHAAIVTKYVQLYRTRTDNPTAEKVARERAKLNAYVTSYLAWTAG